MSDLLCPAQRPASAMWRWATLLAVVFCAAELAAAPETEARFVAPTTLGAPVPANRQKRAAWAMLHRLGAEPVGLEAAMLADAQDGRWNHHALLEAALVASGVYGPDDVRHYRERWERLLNWLRRTSPEEDDPVRLAQHVLETLHARLLTGGYRSEATALQTAFDEGRFNCVSATVLFVCLAEEMGLEVRAVESTGHVAAELLIGGQPLRVETTCAKWFRLGRQERMRQWATIAGRQDDRDHHGRETRRLQPAVVPPGGGPAEMPDDYDRSASMLSHNIGKLRPSRAIDPVKLVAAIYYNRGVDHLLSERFEAAAVCNAKAVLLDPESEQAWGNLLATVNNWAVHLAKQGLYTEAVDLLDQGLAFAPDYRPFRWNRRQAARRAAGDAGAAAAQAAGSLIAERGGGK